MRRRWALALLSLTALSLTGCLISTQEGERSHVNSKHPEEITFHFDTGYNKAVLFGRSAALLLVPLWVFAKRRGGGNTIPAIVGVLALGGAVWLLVSGFGTTFDYRIEVANDRLRVDVPQQAAFEVPWNEIESIEGDGKARNVDFGNGEGQALHWATEWQDLKIATTSGRHHEVDLRPLSVEQRGTLWRAVARKAKLQVTITPGPTRR